MGDKICSSVDNHTNELVKELDTSSTNSAGAVTVSVSGLVASTQYKFNIQAVNSRPQGTNTSQSTVVCGDTRGLSKFYVIACSYLHSDINIDTKIFLDPCT